jgi:gas vesicle protein
MSGSDTSGEEMRVNKKVRDELQEPEGVKEKAKQAVHAVGDKIKDTGKSIKDATDNETVEKVGDTVKGAGKTMKENSSDKQGLGKQDVVTS